MDIIMDPGKIEARSMSIIQPYLEGLPLEAQEKEVARRVIHATGDPGYGEIIRFSPGAVSKGIQLISQGKDLVTDVEMVRAGINKKMLSLWGGSVDCYISHPQVIRQAAEKGITRAAQAVEHAREKINGNIMVIGNAPTALFTVLAQVKSKRITPALIIGVPVGFVGARESKEELEKQGDVPYVTVRGYKGGSPVAVAVVNALLKLVPGQDQ